jgi:ElaA protein
MTRTWILRHHRDLSCDELYRILAFRQQIFVVEQGCAYLDADGKDLTAHHLWLEERAVADTIVACLRILPPGARFAEASLGRIAIIRSERGHGLGHDLVRRGIEACTTLHGDAIRISAQSYLEGFYQHHGFTRCSSEYLEDDIPHLEMLRGS